MKYYISSFGCKVNQYESQQLLQLLNSLALSQTDLDQAPDLIIVHTCCVTHTASSKSRQGIKKTLKANPNAHVIVTGCLPSAPEDELASIRKLGQNIHILDRTKNLKTEISAIISKEQQIETENDHKIKNKEQLASMQYLDPLADYKNQSRAFLKVQDGCDGFCSYCIIPKIRTNVCKKDVKTILTEAKNLVNTNHPEIVLTGIFLGAFGQSTVRRSKWPQNYNPHLPDLVEKVAQTSGLKRLRLSSLEPGDVSDQLLGVFEKYPNIAPHLHLPLQSGSDNILKKMNRQYRRSDYIATIDKIKSRLDRPAITTDIIVGFPGETQEDFRQSMEIAKYVRYCKIHVFPFSARKDTAAYHFKPRISPDVIKQRSKILRELDKTLAKEFRQQFIGENLEVIIEDEKSCSGRTAQYFEVKITNAPDSLKKNDVIIAQLNPNTTTAKFISG